MCVVCVVSAGTSGMRRSCSGTGLRTRSTGCPAPPTWSRGGSGRGRPRPPENVEIIAYLNAIHPFPSNEQYLPSLEFDVLSILQSLAGSSDDGVCGNVGDVMHECSECSRKGDEIEEEALGRLEERTTGYCGFSGKV